MQRIKYGTDNRVASKRNEHKTWLIQTLFGGGAPIGIGRGRKCQINNEIGNRLHRKVE